MMVNILGDPVKLLASLFLFILLLGSLFIAVWNTLHNIPVPVEVTTILGTGVGYCLTALGFAHGANTTSTAANDAVNTLVKVRNESSSTKSS
jgi:hypothetical protein